ncbi:alpha/beta hydrolase [Rhodococcoides trifolii]|uniref:Alpha/beta hydrolase n=1 Tax=Rhodococcoides trifolii TaxID=908250 RepID=A0A917G314_9NOCA|nr:alpha/beta fold hydrolase [Rhodococcus trifolii]GGG20007.1 alpha/beta hydrolase [Rhodococcus trifolii]
MGFTRTEEQFDSRGVRCAAAVFRPESQTGPAVVMAHGFNGVRALRLYAYAERFADAGYTVVVFDYRGFGESEGEPRQVLDIDAQLDDWRSALKFTRALDGVDAGKVVAWGTSFSGGHVITLAASGEPLAAVIAQVPHISGPAAVRATGVKQSLRLAPYALGDQVRSLLGRAPLYVAAAGTPGSKAVMATPDAEPGYSKLISESGLTPDAYPMDVAGRILLRIGLYSPGRHASAITCPALVQIVTEDSITPTAVALKAASKIRNGVVKTYPGGHFDPYVEPLFPTVIADQLAFLADAVPV